MEVVVGTYEELILSYRLVSGEKGYEFELSFTDHSHTGCIRTLDSSRRGILASGSSDEVIRLFNLNKHFEIGSLMHHNGIITGVHFYKKTHMFSTSGDGSIGVWQVGKWECLRTLRGHRGAVNSMSIHPSGKMALSVGADKKLCIWNLMTGKRAFVTNLKDVCDKILWSPDGSTYLVVVNDRLDVYDMGTAEVIQTIKMTGRINHIDYLKENIVIFGGEEGKLYIYNLQKKHCLLDHCTNTTRVKDFSWITDPDNPECLLLITASSDGFIKAWQLKQEEDKYMISPAGEIQTKFRLTCLTLYKKNQSKQQESKPATIKEKLEETKQSKQTSNEEDSEEDVECNADLSTSSEAKSVKFAVPDDPKKKKDKKSTKQVSVERKLSNKAIEKLERKLKKKQKVKRLKQKAK